MTYRDSFSPFGKFKDYKNEYQVVVENSIGAPLSFDEFTFTQNHLANGK